ncbi:hypothetical protein ASE66_26740 [Bosea sp. Root483D1]|uniref:DUF1772 domain-containing protein n=1 Tax=Bosea sp. Root483D1 TaxID=1736544 RepID=UPI00070E0165|nr:DUF1772 domain-containing protein [Bosea sp. Root483D1]KRE22048.1 hypothetical protein ASE66_26740 [Bosea sp. Root483D1]
MPASSLDATAQKSGASATGLVALILATLFAGAAIYILVAEQPARLALEDRSLLLQWQESYPRAARMQAGLAVLASLVGTIAYWRARGRLWLVGATLMLANLPFTLIVIAPVNDALLALGSEQASAASRALIERWGVLHGVRAGLSVLAIAAFMLATARGGYHSALRK